MYLHALATANPDFVLTQRQCAEISRGDRIVSRLNRRSQLILHSVLTGDSGIDRRHFAIREIPDVFDYTADQLNDGFRKHAPILAESAVRKACADANIEPAQIDFLFVCTCTGYLCPGVSSYVGERMRLRPDAVLHDIVGHGCGAAIPMLRLAAATLLAHPDAVVLTVAVEVCSAAFFLDDDPGVLISACLFGDGAAAAIWKGRGGAGARRVRHFSSVHLPEHRDEIRFEHRGGKLRNLLASTVPGLAAEAVGKLYDEEVKRSERPIEYVVAHPGGREVISAIAERLPKNDFDAGRRVLREYGNMSSPSVLFVLKEQLRRGAPAVGKDWWLVAFGAGFSAHACRFGE